MRDERLPWIGSVGMKASTPLLWRILRKSLRMKLATYAFDGRHDAAVAGRIQAVAEGSVRLSFGVMML